MRNLIGIATLFLLGVGISACVKSGLDAAEKEAISDEIIQRLNSYADAVTEKDIEAILSFWSDAGDLVFAGDGAILGGYDEWAPITTQHARETDYFLYWRWKNVNVEALALGAAAATLEYEYSSVSVAGDTTSARGSWTYVFKKYGPDWKVVQSNGHHISK